MNTVSYIPEFKQNLFVENDVTKFVSTIIETNRFFPILLTGPTGVGKTYTISQICAKLERECIRVNITRRSNEDNLMGSFRLVEGSTSFEKGPIIIAMERGAVLLLDEVDLADPEEIMCLQSVMEGNGFYLKSINEQVNPKPGFTIIATANTKGLGDDSGTYVGTNILNEAFLDRFKMCRNVSYPTKQVEMTILANHAKEILLEIPTDYIDKLVTWSNHIRSVASESNEFEHTISTRRLIHILDVFSVFKNEYAAIIDGLSRFDKHHSESFIELYNTYFPSENGATSKVSEDSELIKKFKEQTPW